MFAARCSHTAAYGFSAVHTLTMCLLNRANVICCMLVHLLAAVLLCTLPLCTAVSFSLLCCFVLCAAVLSRCAPQQAYWHLTIISCMQGDDCQLP